MNFGSCSIADTVNQKTLIVILRRARRQREAQRGRGKRKEERREVESCEWIWAGDGVRREAWRGGFATLQVQWRRQILHGQIRVPTLLALLRQLLPSLDAVCILCFLLAPRPPCLLPKPNFPFTLSDSASHSSSSLCGVLMCCCVLSDFGLNAASLSGKKRFRD